tara:strand:+ start:39293 stop:40480 length:1188 start_codon:yes stop_codon:yes gene_type:complete
MNYQQLMQYFTELESGTNKLSLEPITKLMQALNNPHLDYKTIHVTGTNGKGSTTAMLHSVLSQKYKTGRFTSPHLIDIKERIHINENITEEQFIATALKVKQAADSIQLNPSYFEFITAMAFLYFKEQQCEYVIMEVGLGGRLDSTNIIQPEISIITNIELDHTKTLGNTKQAIAKEKAGIIKENSVLVTGEQDQEILEYFQQVCQEKSTKFIKAESSTLPSSLLGNYQINNKGIAVETLKQLQIDKKMVEKGLIQTKWPGRFEIMQSKPQVILDCAHNPAGVQQLKESIKNLTYNELILVMGTSKNKDYKSMIDLITPLANKIFFTKASYRALDPQELKNKTIKPSEIIENVTNAVQKALEIANYDDLILICGSIFLVGEARTHWYPHPVKFFR